LFCLLQGFILVQAFILKLLLAAKISVFSGLILFRLKLGKSYSFSFLVVGSCVGALLGSIFNFSALIFFAALLLKQGFLFELLAGNGGESKSFSVSHCSFFLLAVKIGLLLFASIDLSLFLSQFGRFFSFELLFALHGHFLLFGGFGLNLLTHILFLFLLFSDNLEVSFVVTSFNLVSFLVVLMVDLGVVLVLAATTTVCSLVAAFFEVAVHLVAHEAASLTVESVLELEETGVILRTEVHSHVLALGVSVHIVALCTIGIIFSKLKVHVCIVFAHHWRDGPSNNHPWVSLEFPARGQVHHRLALPVSKLS